MKIGFYSTLMALLTGTGLAQAQPPAAQPTTPNPPAFPGPGAYVGDYGVLSVPPTPELLSQPPVIDPIDNPSFRWWFDAEYLLWTMKQAQLPPLQIQQAGAIQLTSSTTVIDANGNVSSNTVQPFIVPVLVAVDPGIAQGDFVNIGYTNGVRLTLGGWFDPNQDVGFEARGFFFEHQPFYFNNTTASVNTTVNLPFSNQTIIQPGGGLDSNVQVEDTPILLDVTGSVILVGRQTNQFSGAELNARANFLRIGGLTFDMIAGVRNLNLVERLDTAVITDLEATPQNPIPPQPGLVLPDPVPIPISLTLLDMIKTRNNYYGGQFGTNVEGWAGRWFVNGRAVLGVGGVHQVIRIFNGNASTSEFESENFGGLLTGILDQGTFDHDKVALMTDFEVKFGYLVASGIRIFVGYDWLNVSHFTRPGDVVHFTTTTTNILIGGTEETVRVSEPGFGFNDSALWVQGINFGIELRY